MPGLTGHLIPTPVVREMAATGVCLLSLILSFYGMLELQHSQINFECCFRVTDYTILIYYIRDNVTAPLDNLFPRTIILY